MKPSIIKKASLKSFYIPERCHIKEYMNEAPCSIAEARVEVGVTTVLHALKGVDELYYLLAGKGEVEVDGQILGEVGVGDLVKIPKNTSQRIRNIGTEDLLFLCICVPAFQMEAYVDLEA